MIPNTTNIEVRLLGQSGFWDVPPIPDRLSCKFELMIYDKTEDTVSIGLKEYGIWEGWETVLVLEILKTGDNSKIVVDLGSHIGWYSIIAAMNGYKVYAFDESTERIAMLNESARLNNCNNNISCTHIRIDKDTKLPVDFSCGIRFFKCDLDANDLYAVKLYYHLFKAGMIDYAMIEISPCFNNSYIELVELIAECGYDVYIIPDKLFRRRIEYGAYPLQTLKESCLIPGGYEAFINKLQQENFLFIKK